METKHAPGDTTKHEEPAGSILGSQREGYERRDADIGSLLKFAFWLGVMLVAVLFAMKWTFFYFERTQPLGQPASPFENTRTLPPNPRLQVQPAVDLKSYCEAQQQELNSYGWMDRHNGAVRIPVDRAIDIVLERGLPARQGFDGFRSGAIDRETGTRTGAPQTIGTLGPCGYLTAQSSAGARQ